VKPAFQSRGCRKRATETSAGSEAARSVVSLWSVRRRRFRRVGCRDRSSGGRQIAHSDAPFEFRTCVRPLLQAAGSRVGGGRLGSCRPLRLAASKKWGVTMTMQRSKPNVRKARIRQPLKGHGVRVLGGRLPPGRYAIRFSHNGTGGEPTTGAAREHLLAASGCLEDGLGELEGLLVRLGHGHGQHPSEVHEAVGHVVEALRLLSTAYWQVARAPAARGADGAWPYRGRSPRLS